MGKAPYEEANVATGNKTMNCYANWLVKSKKFIEDDAKRPKVLSAVDQPWENSQQGRLRHIINEQLDLREYAVDMYIQEIPPGSKSGKHYHASEEMLFILEGSGYDLHWDPKPRIEDKYYWEWKEQALKLPWSDSYFVYIPPLVVHQHFNASKTEKARFISNTCRTVKDIGYDWLVQLENCPEWK